MPYRVIDIKVDSEDVEKAIKKVNDLRDVIDSLKGIKGTDILFGLSQQVDSIASGFEKIKNNSDALVPDNLDNTLTQLREYKGLLTDISSKLVEIEKQYRKLSSITNKPIQTTALEGRLPRRKKAAHSNIDYDYDVSPSGEMTRIIDRKRTPPPARTMIPYSQGRPDLVDAAIGTPQPTNIIPKYEIHLAGLTGRNRAISPDVIKRSIQSINKETDGILNEFRKKGDRRQAPDYGTAVSEYRELIDAFNLHTSSQLNDATREAISKVESKQLDQGEMKRELQKIAAFDMVKKNISYSDSTRSDMHLGKVMRKHGISIADMPSPEELRVLAMAYTSRLPIANKDVPPGSTMVQPSHGHDTYQSYGSAFGNLQGKGWLQSWVRPIMRNDMPEWTRVLPIREQMRIARSQTLHIPKTLTELGKGKFEHIIGQDRVSLGPEWEHMQVNPMKLSDKDLPPSESERNFNVKALEKAQLYREGGVVINMGTKKKPNKWHKELLDSRGQGFNSSINEALRKAQDESYAGKFNKRDGFKYVEWIRNAADFMYNMQAGMVPEAMQHFSFDPMRPDNMKSYSDDTAGKNRHMQDIGDFFSDPKLKKHVTNSTMAVAVLEEMAAALSINVKELQRNSNFIALSVGQVNAIRDNLAEMIRRASPNVRTQGAANSAEALQELFDLQSIFGKYDILDDLKKSGADESELKDLMERIDEDNLIAERIRDKYGKRYRETGEPEIVAKNPVRQRMPGGSILAGVLRDVKMAAPLPKESESLSEGTGLNKPGKPMSWAGPINETTYRKAFEFGPGASYNQADDETKKRFLEEVIIPYHGSLARYRKIFQGDMTEFHERFKVWWKADWQRRSIAERNLYALQREMQTAISSRMPLSDFEYDKWLNPETGTDITGIDTRSEDEKDLDYFHAPFPIDEYSSLPDIVRDAIDPAGEDDGEFRILDSPNKSYYDDAAQRNHNRGRASELAIRKAMNSAAVQLKKYAPMILAAGASLALGSLFPGAGHVLPMLGMLGAVKFKGSDPDDEKLAANEKLWRDSNPNEYDKFLTKSISGGAPMQDVIFSSAFRVDKNFSAVRLGEMVDKLNAAGMQVQSGTTIAGQGKNEAKYATVQANMRVTQAEYEAKQAALSAIFNEYKYLLSQQGIGIRTKGVYNKAGSKRSAAEEAEIARAERKAAMNLIPTSPGMKMKGFRDINRILPLENVSPDELLAIRERFAGILGQGAQFTETLGGMGQRNGKRFTTTKLGISRSGMSTDDYEKIADSLEEALFEYHDIFGGRRTIQNKDKLYGLKASMDPADARNIIDSTKGMAGRGRNAFDQYMGHVRNVTSPSLIERKNVAPYMETKGALSPDMLNEMKTAYGRLGENVRVTTKEMVSQDSAGKELRHTLTTVHMDMDPAQYEERREKIEELSNAFGSVNGAVDHGVKAGTKYNETLSMTAKAGNTVTRAAGGFRSFAWSLTFLNMSFLGVAFSMMGIAGLFSRAISTMLSPVMDLNNMFEALGMMMAFGGDEAQAFGENINVDDWVQGWQNLTGLVSTFTAKMIDFAMKFLTDEDFMAGITDSIFKLFDVLGREEVVKAIKDIVTAVVNALPTIAETLPSIANAIKWMSETEIGDNSLLEWLVKFGIWAQIALPIISPISAFFSGLSAILQGLGAVVTKVWPYIWGFFVWFGEAIANLLGGGALATLIGGFVSGLVLGLGTVFILMKTGVLEFIKGMGAWFAEVSKDNPLLSAIKDFLIVALSPFTLLGVIIIDALNGNWGMIETHLDMWANQIGAILASKMLWIFQTMQQAPLIGGLADGGAQWFADRVNDFNSKYSQLSIKANGLQTNSGSWMPFVGDSSSDTNKSESGATPSFSETNKTATQYVTQYNTQTNNFGDINSQADLDEFADKIRTQMVTTPG